MLTELRWIVVRPGERKLQYRIQTNVTDSGGKRIYSAWVDVPVVFEREEKNA